MNEREISPCSLTLCIAEYGNYSVCLSYIMIVLYIWWYQCNVACSTMCTERLVRLTIDGYVLLVAHIIRRCTTCSIENSRLCRGIKTIVYTLNYYTRILVSSFPLRLYFSRNFFSFSFLFQAWPGTSRRQSEIGTVSGVCISFLKRNVAPLEEDRVKPVRTFVLL